MALLARQRGCDRIEAVATSAVRDAVNGDAFTKRVRRLTGLQISHLTGEDEARLSFRSALAHFDMGARRSVVLDVGGGSLELAFSAAGVLERLVSLPLGAIRMMERFPSLDAGRKGLARLRRHVRRALRDATPVRDWRRAQLIASGGTLTNLAGMHLARRGMPSVPNVHGTAVPRADVEHILDTLAQMSPSERLHVPGLNGERADIIVAGLGVVAEVIAWLDTRDVVVSRYGIREGIVLEAARVAPRAADAGMARARSVTELAERCGYDAAHAHQVRVLALQLFDALGERLELSSADRSILADAALLHDIGYHIGYDKHHKHSCHIIEHAELLGTAPLDQLIIATVARYHRGARPKRSHRPFGTLDKATRRRIRRLAALLRIADGFDRGHVGAVERLSVRRTARAIRITPTPARGASSLRLELWGASRKVELLERELEVPVELVDPAGASYDGEAVASAGVAGSIGR
jgi:exopolyphosphatase/guanosine-5'-triphosphate,3'-diphosphate pyrophosphatase